MFPKNTPRFHCYGRKVVADSANIDFNYRQQTKEANKKTVLCRTLFVLRPLIRKLLVTLPLFFVLNQRNPERMPQKPDHSGCAQSPKPFLTSRHKWRKKYIYYSAVETTRLLHNWQLFPGNCKTIRLSLCATLVDEAMFDSCLHLI